MPAEAGGAREPRPLTYDDAESVYRSDLAAAREQYAALAGRDLAARSAALLRERGEFDTGNSVHAEWASGEPLSTAERLERIAIGEVLARYYRHPSVVHAAVRAGAGWEQIGGARGICAAQARRDYREWVGGQHRLYVRYGRWGLNDTEYARACRRASDGPASAMQASEPGASRPVLRSELQRLRRAGEEWEESARACICPPGRCTRGEFRDHTGQSEGCMVCADLDPDQPCYEAVARQLRAQGAGQ